MVLFVSFTFFFAYRALTDSLQVRIIQMKANIKAGDWKIIKIYSSNARQELHIKNLFTIGNIEYSIVSFDNWQTGRTL